MFKKIVVIILVLGASCAAGAYLWQKRNAAFYYAGTIEATKVDVPARLASVIATRHVAEGDQVAKDAPLVSLACEDLKIQRQLASANLARAIKLRRAGSMPEDAFDEINFRFADLDLKLAWCTVRSPLTGTVLTNYREAGEWVAPGSKLMTLADLGEVWAYVYAPLGVMAQLKLGEKVAGYIPELSMQKFEGTLVKINEEAEFTPKNVQTREERTRLVYGIKVRFANEKGILKPGMTIEVELPE